MEHWAQLSPGPKRAIHMLSHIGLSSSPVASGFLACTGDRLPATSDQSNLGSGSSGTESQRHLPGKSLVHGLRGGTLIGWAWITCPPPAARRVGCSEQQALPKLHDWRSWAQRNGCFQKKKKSNLFPTCSPTLQIRG